MILHTFSLCVLFLVVSKSHATRADDLSKAIKEFSNDFHLVRLTRANVIRLFVNSTDDGILIFFISSNASKRSQEM